MNETKTHSKWQKSNSTQEFQLYSEVHWKANLALKPEEASEYDGPGVDFGPINNKFGLKSIPWKITVILSPTKHEVNKRLNT